jgi:hypothetical protein
VCRIPAKLTFLLRLSLCYSNYFKQGSHATATVIPPYINLHNIFSQCRPVRYIADMLRRK